jgi:hypothetical protein
MSSVSIYERIIDNRKCKFVSEIQLIDQKLRSLGNKSLKNGFPLNYVQICATIIFIHAVNGNLMEVVLPSLLRY